MSFCFYRNLVQKSLCTVGMIALPTLGFASAEPTANEADFVSEIPIILTATRLLQPINETPVSTTIIDHQTIQNMGATNIADLLRLVPGMQVGHGSSANFSVTYHGNSSTFSRRMQVQIDGRSVYSPLFSVVDWTHLGIAIEDIERIEVIRGSNTPIDGTNAFIGTINIITRQPFQDKGVYISGTKGAQGYGREMLRIAGETGPVEQRLTLEHREDNGFDQVYDSQSLDMVAYRGSYFPSQKDSFDFQLGYSRGPEGIGSFDDPLDPARYKETHASYGFIRWERIFSDTNDLYVQFYQNRLVWSDKEDIVGPLSSLFGVSPATILALTGNPDQTVPLGLYDGEAERMDLDFRNTIQVTGDIRLIWGGGLRRDRFKTLLNLDRPDPIDNYSRRLNGHLEWTMSERLVTNAGVMIEHNDLSDTEISPRLALNYHLDHAQTLRFAVARSARMPSIYEARGENIVRFDSGDIIDITTTNIKSVSPDLDVRPELLDTYEIGYVLFLPVKKLQLDAKIYKDEITKVISGPTLRPFNDLYDQKAFVWMNSGNIKIHGLDLGLDFQPSPNTRVILAYGYARADGRILKRWDLDTNKTIYWPNEPGNNQQANSVPRHTVSLMTSHHFPRHIDTSVTWYHVSDMEWLGDGDPVKGYDRFDLRLAKGFSLFNSTASVELLVQNLFDDGYIDTVKNNRFGQRMFMNVNLKY
ncbi:MAG: TonB-dependent receptor [Gammaproteobacteria bacterium]|nr:TonB-dependent receptor [Gammaproteobacteria bacterium]